MANTLGPGDARVGHLFDGIDDNLPDQVATLTFEATRGAELTVPFFWEDEGGPNPQYRKAREWFDLQNETLPKTLVFADDKGHVTLTGLHVSGSSIGSVPVGRARAQAVIFGRPRSHRDEYLVNELMSTIDGLEEFAGFRPVNIEHGQTEDGHRRTTVVLDASEVVEWETGGFKYKIQSNLSWHGGRSFTVDDSRPYISTAREGGATLWDHLEAQWPIRALLVLVHGTKLAWRSHRLRDNEFPMWMLNGSDRGPYAVEVQLAGTIEQHRFPEPTSHSLALVPLTLSELGAEGMKRWVELYADPNFERAIQPAVEVLNGASRFLEPQLMMLAISLDYLGYFRFGDGRRRTMADHIQKCLDEASLDWPEIGSREGIAKAIAAVNNDLKHPDRQTNPDSDVLAGISALAEIIVRAQVFDLLGVDETRRQRFLGYNDARHAVEIFATNGIAVADDGTFTRVARQPEVDASSQPAAIEEATPEESSS